MVSRSKIGGALRVHSQTQPTVGQSTIDYGDSKNVKTNNFGRAIGKL